MDGLLRDAELVRDLLPGKPAVPRALDVDPFHTLEQRAQRGDRPQALRVILRCDLNGQISSVLHAVNFT